MAVAVAVAAAAAVTVCMLVTLNLPQTLLWRIVQVAAGHQVALACRVEHDYTICQAWGRGGLSRWLSWPLGVLASLPDDPTGYA